MSREPSAKQTVGLLLAAGRGKRFDASGQQDKLMALLPSAVPVAVAAANNLRAALPRVIAVVRPQATELAAALEAAGCEVIVCNNADEGMGTVLAFAVQHSADAQAWLVALADMPYIRSETYSALLEALNEHDLVAPTFGGQRGHPVGFAQCHLNALLQIKGEQGARQLLSASTTFFLATDDPGVLRDIDTRADL